MPVEISQACITPSESYVVVMPSFDCRVIDSIGAGERDADFRLVIARSVDLASTCQNLTDLSWGAETRVVEEENVREVISWEWPMKVLTSWGSEVVISQQ